MNSLSSVPRGRSSSSFSRFLNPSRSVTSHAFSLRCFIGMIRRALHRDTQPKPAHWDRKRHPRLHLQETRCIPYPQLGHNCSRMKYWVARGAGKHMSIIGATSFSSLICINQGISLDLEEANNTLLLSIRGAISDPSYAFVTPFP